MNPQPVNVSRSGRTHREDPITVARPYRRAQTGDGRALKLLEDRIACLIGEHIGGRIAEENAIDEPFCRQLARATDPCAQTASMLDEGDAYGANLSYIFYLPVPESPENVHVAVMLEDDGYVDAAWWHPDPHPRRHSRSVRAAAGPHGGITVNMGDSPDDPRTGRRRPRTDGRHVLGLGRLPRRTDSGEEGAGLMPAAKRRMHARSPGVPAPNPRTGAGPVPDQEWPEAELGRLIGEHVGGRIADQNTFDDHFCRQLARAVEPFTKPARVLRATSDSNYAYQLEGSDVVVSMTSFIDFIDDSDIDGHNEAMAVWRHPHPAPEQGYRIVDARTYAGFRFVTDSDADPALADAARRLLAGIQTAWDAYWGHVDAQHAAG